MSMAVHEKSKQTAKVGGQTLQEVSHQVSQQQSLIFRGYVRPVRPVRAFLKNYFWADFSDSMAAISLNKNIWQFRSHKSHRSHKSNSHAYFFM
jgi:hypothetical protein